MKINCFQFLKNTSQDKYLYQDSPTGIVTSCLLVDPLWLALQMIFIYNSAALIFPLMKWSGDRSSIPRSYLLSCPPATPVGMKMVTSCQLPTI